MTTSILEYLQWWAYHAFTPDQGARSYTLDTPDTLDILDTSTPDTLETLDTHDTYIYIYRYDRHPTS
jgi:hypothetical protein